MSTQFLRTSADGNILYPVLSHIQVKPLKEAWQRDPAEQAIDVSLDLGRSQTSAQLSESGLQFEHPQLSATIRWEMLDEILANENGSYQLFGSEGEIERINFFSEEMQRAYSLFPTRSAPTMLVSGITMHRIVDCDPWLDTQNKLKALGRPPSGAVLDTSMGLGYTASLAAESASHVLTIEIDPTVVSVCRANPWSQALFNRPNIERVIGHSWDVIETLPSNTFGAIIHDPPMFNMAGELYSLDFYKELYRVLKNRGRLFHYIGNPNSRSGASVTKGTIKRLKQAGFQKIAGRPAAFGVLANK